jgi:uncharacterized protein (DUF2147 family)
MRFKTMTMGVLAVAVMMPLQVSSAAADGIDGAWLTEDKEAVVQISACPGSAARCGTIVWLKTQTDKSGNPIRDAKNPKVELRGRSLCGLEIINGLKPVDDGGYDGAALYDPEEGNLVTGAAKLEGAALKITGYVGSLGKLLSESETWSRAPAAFTPCTAQAAKK